MSKRHKKKHFSQYLSQGTADVKQSSVVADKNSAVYSAHREEYRNISSDLIRVAIINGLFVVAVLALYYYSQQNPFLDNWYDRLF